MDPATPSVPQPPPSRGLPPVTPPSGRFIAQLFLVPGLIVLVAVLLLMMFHNLFGSSQTAEQFLRQLDSANDEVRWRAANDLTATLEQSGSTDLRADPEFALQLVIRLQQAIEDLEAHKSQAPVKPAESGSKKEEPPNPKLKYVSFLTQAVARVSTPLGIVVLGNLAVRSDKPDDSSMLVRRQALLAIAVVGDNIRNFSKLTDEQRGNILDFLQKLAESKEGTKSTWARTALFYLPGGTERIGTGEVVHMDDFLARCAEADDPYARSSVAFALRFWNGPKVESTLKKLTSDDGHGKTMTK